MCLSSIQVQMQYQSFQTVPYDTFVPGLGEDSIIRQTPWNLCGKIYIKGFRNIE